MSNIEKIIQFIQSHIFDYTIRIIAAVIIFYVGRFFANFFAKIIFRAMSKTHMDATLTDFVRNAAYAFLLAIVVIAALNALGVETTSLVAVLGATGLAVGLSLRDQISNFGAGVLIVLLRPFKVGDSVTLAGQSGSVLTIQIFQTILKTYDNLTIMIPNSKVMNGEIINFSLMGTRMIPLTIGISYESDIKKAKDIALKIMNEHENVLKDPKPTCGVLELGDSSVNLFVRSWTTTANWWITKADLLENIKINFEQNGISIPYPQMDVHVSNNNREDIS